MNEARREGIAGRTPEAVAAKLPVARNTFLLSASMAALYGMMQLSTAISAITFVAVAGPDGFAGLGHGHHQEAVFPVISAHFLGMFGLVLVVGRIIDRAGRTRALVGGLLLLGSRSWPSPGPWRARLRCRWRSSG